MSKTGEKSCGVVLELKNHQKILVLNASFRKVLPIDEALEYCKSIDAVLPSTEMMKEISLNADEIDKLDSTINEVPEMALGDKNPNGRWYFNGSYNAWEENICKEHNEHTLFGIPSDEAMEMDAFGVIPIFVLNDEEEKITPNN